jgi:hypothetical protein
VGQTIELAPAIAVAVLGLLLIGKFVIIPIVNIVFGHQRQLAGVESPAVEVDRSKVERLEAEVQELRDRLNEQAILIDDRRKLDEPTNIEGRLRS